MNVSGAADSRARGQGKSPWWGKSPTPWDGNWNHQTTCVPTLSESKRTVGFHGKKVEDLNKTSVLG